MFLRSYNSLRSEILLRRIQNYGKRKKEVFLSTFSEPISNVTDFKELEKGCLLFVEGEAYPMRMSISADRVRDVSVVKRAIPMLLKGLGKKGLVRKSISALGLLANFTEIIDWMHFALQEVYTEPDRYSQPVRELYRVMTGRGELTEKLRDIFCAILEYDCAYRFRFQDIAMEMDITTMKYGPIEEMDRLFGIIMEREVDKDGGGFSRFLRYKKYIFWYLKVNRKLLKEVSSILSSINISEVWPSVEDRYYMLRSSNYLYFGMSNKDRESEREKMKSDHANRST